MMEDADDQQNMASCVIDAVNTDKQLSHNGAKTYDSYLTSLKVFDVLMRKPGKLFKQK